MLDNPKEKGNTMKTLEIGGEFFEVIRSKMTEQMIECHNHDYLGRKTLYDYYVNPSAIKIGIWEDWREWQAENWPMVSNMRVTSASCSTFSIGAIYSDPETYEVLGYFRITKEHNRLYLLK